MTELLAAPVAGYKLCRIRWVDGRFVLAPLHDRPGGLGWYSPTSYANCDEGHGHRVPDRSCTCGFHAVDSRDALWRLGWTTPATPVLEVELSGAVIEHRHGVRAERQDVTRVHLPARCARCGRLAVRSTSGRSGLLVSVCDRHGRRAVTPSVLTEALGVDVQFDDPDGRRIKPVVVARIAAARFAPFVIVASAGVAGWTWGGQPSAAMATVPVLLPWLLGGSAVSARALRRSTDSTVERARVGARLQAWAVACTAVVWVSIAAPAAVATMLAGAT